MACTRTIHSASLSPQRSAHPILGLHLRLGSTGRAHGMVHRYSLILGSPNKLFSRSDHTHLFFFLAHGSSSEAIVESFAHVKAETQQLTSTWTVSAYYQQSAHQHPPVSMLMPIYLALCLWIHRTPRMIIRSFNFYRDGM